MTRQQIKIAPYACPKLFSSTFPAHLRFHIQKRKTPQLEWMAIKKTWNKQQPLSRSFRNFCLHHQKKTNVCRWKKFSLSYQARLLTKRYVCTFFRCHVVKHRKDCGDSLLEESEFLSHGGGEFAVEGMPQGVRR